MNQLSNHNSGQALLDFFADDYQRLSPRGKVAVIKAFAVYLRELGEGLGLPALRGIRIRQGTGWEFSCSDRGGRGQTAVAVTALFLHRTSRNEKLRFFRHYLDLSRKLKHYRAELHDLELRAIDLLAKGEWRQLGRQVVAGGGRVPLRGSPGICHQMRQRRGSGADHQTDASGSPASL